MGHVISSTANNAHTEKSCPPPGCVIHKLYITDFVLTASPDVKLPNGRQRHIIVKITATNRKIVCFRCIIAFLFDCLSVCRANIRCRQ